MVRSRDPKKLFTQKSRKSDPGGVWERDSYIDTEMKRSEAFLDGLGRKKKPSNISKKKRGEGKRRGRRCATGRQGGKGGIWQRVIEKRENPVCNFPGRLELLGSLGEGSSL